MKFDTTDFQAAHGRRPRGNGSWAFFFRRKADVSEAFWVNGSFSEAKAAAAAEATKRGVRCVFVGS